MNKKTKATRKANRKSGKMSRAKGQNGEREAAKLLSALTGIECRRKVGDSYRDLGCSDIEIEDASIGWSVEVKRQEKLQLHRWWAQAVRQALREQRRPLLMWRQNGKSWTLMYYCNGEPVTSSAEKWAEVMYNA